MSVTSIVYVLGTARGATDALVLLSVDEHAAMPLSAPNTKTIFGGFITQLPPILALSGAHCGRTHQSCVQSPADSGV